MCGIAGMMNLQQTAPVPETVLRRMAEALWHRGPDADGYFYRPHLGLASRRLSLVGLADGRQPISNEDGTATVVFNGELFDYVEQRAELQRRGHRLRTHCDTEIVPHLWENHGEAMLGRLRGQFALALWDERQRQLLLARDRFGICPLFWTRLTRPDGEWLLFASEIKALLASGWIAPRPDVRGLHHVFTFFATPGPMTCFQGIQTLLPGQYLQIRLGQPASNPVQEKLFWAVDFPDRGDEVDGKPEQLADELEALLARSVERRLRADVPVVSYLSGGVDSSVVVALASQQRRQSQGRPIPTFTIRVNDPHLDESEQALQLAHLLGAEALVIDCGRLEVLQHYPDLIQAAEAPVVHTACTASLMLARAVHEHGYRAVLTGEGSDEWLAGYPWFKAHKVLSWLDCLPGVKLSQLVRRGYMKLAGLPSVPSDIARRNQAALGGLNAYLNVYGLFSTSKYRLFSPWLQQELADHVPYEDLGLNLERVRRWHPLNRSLAVGARVLLPGLLLSAKGDRVAMRSSVEARYPFLDEDVVAFNARLHPHWKLRGLREKYLLRKVAERWLPAEVAWRRKAMFRTPRDGFHQASPQQPAFVEQLLSRAALQKTGYFDTEAVHYWRQAYQQMRARSQPRVMIEMGLVGVIATQLWHHTFIDSSLADLPAWSPPSTTALRRAA